MALSIPAVSDGHDIDDGHQLAVRSTLFWIPDIHEADMIMDIHNRIRGKRGYEYPRNIHEVEHRWQA